MVGLIYPLRLHQGGGKEGTDRTAPGSVPVVPGTLSTALPASVALGWERADVTVWPAGWLQTSGLPHHHP